MYPIEVIAVVAGLVVLVLLAVVSLRMARPRRRRYWRDGAYIPGAYPHHHNDNDDDADHGGFDGDSFISRS